ncbi:MAG: NosD domain-containing protein, partial [Candidatus Kariarchaeaceae archaeon]
MGDCGSYQTLTPGTEGRTLRSSVTPILIDENTDFNVTWLFPGSGTVLDPFRIEGWTFWYPGEKVLEIRDTTAYFIIVNNTFVASDVGIYISNVVNGIIEENIVVGNAFDGIYIENSNALELSKNTIYQNGESGIHLVNSYDTLIFDNIVLDNGWDGIHLIRSTSNTIQNNVAYHNSIGILLEESSSDNLIEVNWVFGNFNDGISLRGILPCNTNEIAANHVYTNKGNGISVSDLSSSNTISSNFIHENRHSGVDIWNSTFNEVSFNSVYKNWGWGAIHIDSTDIGIYNNTILDNFGNGLILVNTQSSFVSGNTISGSRFVAIRILTSSNNQMFQNNLHNNLEDGIVLERSFDNFIGDNTINNNNWNGIRVIRSDHNEIFDNEISGNNENGIYLWKSGDITIRVNQITNNNADGIFLDDFANANTIYQNTIYANQNGIYIGTHNPMRFYDTVMAVAGARIHWQASMVDPDLGLLTESYNNYTVVLKLNGVTYGTVRSEIYWVEADQEWRYDWDFYSPPLQLGTNTFTTDFFNSGVFESNWTATVNVVYWRNNQIYDNQIYDNRGNGLEVVKSNANDIHDNQIQDNINDGISLRGSVGNLVHVNFISNNGLVGIRIDNDFANNVVSEYNEIINNELASNKESGIHIDTAGDNNVSRNNLYDNNVGISLVNSQINIIAENFIHRNLLFGCEMHGSSLNLILDNTFSYNGREGLVLLDISDDNTILFNDFIYNQVNTLSQAFDDGVNNAFSDNFWSEWIAPDSTNDGIVDEVYFIASSTDNKDLRPLTRPNHPDREHFLSIILLYSPMIDEIVQGTIVIEWSEVFDSWNHQV